MTFDINKPFRRIDGRPIRVLCTDAAGDYPIVVLHSHGREEFPYTYTKDGYHYVACTGLSKQPYDLENIPERHVHADCIIAWADGAKIECDVGCGWYPAPHPSWSPEYKYRVMK